MDAVAAWTLVVAWVTVLAGNVVFYYRCETDCGDAGARGLFFLLVLLIPAAVLGTRHLLRGGLSPRGRMHARLLAAGYAIVALWVAFGLLFAVTLGLAVVAAACWRLGRRPAPSSASPDSSPRPATRS